jgi:hypothetical protein
MTRSKNSRFSPAHWFVVEIELDDVVGGHIRGRHTAGEPVALWVARIARADVSVGVEDAAVSEDVVRRHEVVDQLSMGHREAQAVPSRG